MTWTKLSDDFSDDCWTLSDAAFRLHVEGLVWSNRKLLDLHLPAEDVRRFAKRPEVVDELLAVGWWTEDGDGYLIRHHGTYQRPREAVLKQQAANEANGRKGGRPPKPRREQAGDLRPETQSVSESVTGPGAADSRSPQSSTLAETHSLTQSKTERDRTGRDRASKNGTTTEVEPTGSPWPRLRLCPVCQSPVDSKLPDSTHPTCAAAA